MIQSMVIFMSILAIIFIVIYRMIKRQAENELILQRQKLKKKFRRIDGIDLIREKLKKGKF
ncbi:hypothetical protein FACS1894152_6700 [Bacilli bacterium]|nr:hypothetical protein FACS1894152_6700 [Bacilli bacterium]